MKNIHSIIGLLIAAFTGSFQAQASNNADSVKVSYKNKTVAIAPSGRSKISFSDTSLNSLIIVNVNSIDMNNKENKDDGDVLEGIEEQLDSSSKKIIKVLRNHDKKSTKFIETSLFSTFDIGFANTMNETDNSYAFNPKLTKSANISLGLINFDMNFYKDRLKLSAGLALNNYYLKYSDKQMIQTLDNQGHLTQIRDSVNNFRKNRLDIRYLSVPVLLEYRSKNSNFRIAAGVEYNFNGRTQYKQKGDNESGDFRQKHETNIKINPVQMNAVLRIGVEDVAVFAKYALTDMYKDSAYASGNNPHQRMMSFGICIFGI